MTEQAASDLNVEVLVEDEDKRFAVSVGGRPVARGVRVGIGETAFSTLDLDPSIPLHHAEVIAVVAAVTEHFAEVAGVLFDITDPLLRHQLRRGGFIGGLRALLAPPASHPSATNPPTNIDRGTWLAASVNALLPDARVAAHEPQGWLSRIRDAAVSGNTKSLRMRVGASFDLVVPDCADLMPEVAAMVCDTAMRVEAAFPRELRSLRSIAFDKSERRFSDGHVAGVAQQTLAEVHLNAHFARADEFLAWRNRSSIEMHRKGMQWPADEWMKTLFFHERWRTQIDGLVAHELWHIIDGVFQRTRYRESIEFRRRLGEALGADTLEHALVRDEAARTQIQQQVSDYATTNASEATAEMFRALWCGRDPLPPVVQAFGQLVGEFWPGVERAR